MIKLFSLRVTLSRFIDGVNDLLDGNFSMNEDDNWIYVISNRSFLSPVILGYLPVSLISYLSIDSTCGSIRLMFAKSDFES